MAYLPVGSARNLGVVFAAVIAVEVCNTYGPPTGVTVCGSHDPAQCDDQLSVRQMAPVWFVVPLLSREGLTRRLLAGAAAPWSPALDPVLKSAEAPRFVLKSPAIVFVFETAV